MNGQLTAPLIATLSKRDIYENISDLIQVAPNINHTLLLVNYNEMMNDFYKGTSTDAAFTVQKTKLWESALFFIGRLRNDSLQEFIKRIAGTEADAGIKKKSILYIASSPKDIAALQVGFEFKKIKASLESGAAKDQFELLSPLMSVTLEDFLRAKYTFKPAIIHFSGHGLQDGLMFSTDQNIFQVIPAGLLKEVFKGIETYASCVLLNACYASEQAKMISENGVYAIGMNAPVTDTAALLFSGSFYRFLCDGQDFEESFRNTRLLVEAAHSEEAKTMEIWKNGRLLPGYPSDVPTGQ